MNVHGLLHYGYKHLRDANDDILNGIHTPRLLKKDNVDLLLTESDCYSFEDETCKSLNPTRIFHADVPFYGLTALTSRMLLYIEQMKETNLSLINEYSDNIRFLSSSLRNDLREGIEMLI